MARTNKDFEESSFLSMDSGESLSRRSSWSFIMDDADTGGESRGSFGIEFGDFRLEDNRSNSESIEGEEYQNAQSLNEFAEFRCEQDLGRSDSRDTEYTSRSEMATIVQQFERVPKRKRILHDIIAGEIGRLEHIVRSLIARAEKYQGNIIIVSKHYAEGNEHIHCVHDCNYYNSSCRCSLLSGIPVKRRRLRHGIWSTEIQRKFIENLTEYLSSEPRINVYYKIGRTTWRSVHSTKNIRQERHSREGSEQLLEVCQEENEYNNSEGRCESPISSRSTAKRMRKDNTIVSFSDKRKSETNTIYEWFTRFFPSPISGGPGSIQWLLNPVLKLVNRSHKSFKDASEAFERLIHIKSIPELFELLLEGTPIFSCIDGNFDDKYYNIEDSVEKLEQLIDYQNQYDDMQKRYFIKTLYSVLDRKSSKQNCIVIYGEYSAGKSLFARIIKNAMICYGQILNMNKHSQFPFNNCVNKRILHWDEPNFEPSAIEVLKTLFSGDETPANIKHQDFATITKTPVIVTSNRMNFPTTETFMSRLFIFKWSTASFLKDWEKSINPLSLYYLFLKYELFNPLKKNIL